MAGSVVLEAPAVEVPAVASSKPLTVLVVDDDSLVLMNTALMLEDAGHAPLEAHSAKGALEILEQGFLPDVVVTDHAMPQMTGAELVDRIAETHPDLPVVLATGYAELPHGAKVSGVKLSKPFSISFTVTASAQTIHAISA